MHANLGPVLESLIAACRSRGLFRSLDARAYRTQAELVASLGARPALALALDALSEAGVLERRQDAFRLPAARKRRIEKDSPTELDERACDLSNLLFGTAAEAETTAHDLRARILRAFDGIEDVGPIVSRPAMEDPSRLDEEPSETLRHIAASLPQYLPGPAGELVDAATLLRMRQTALVGSAQEGEVVGLESFATTHPMDPATTLALRLAGLFPSSPADFLDLAADASLFGSLPPRRIPQCGDSQAVIYRFQTRDYRVRYACDADLDALFELEILCWPELLRSSPDAIRRRVENHPSGQLVLERGGRVLGVVYSQRIDDPDILAGRTMDDVEQLHTPLGSVVQLLAVNIHPDTQNLGYGDQLLEFMLQRCSLIPGIRRIVAVTLCRSFQARSGCSFEDYLGEAWGIDPILGFHYAHGADLVGALPGYRPRDTANLGNGVLVSYDPPNRRRREAAAMDHSLSRSTFVPARDLREAMQAEAAALLRVEPSEVNEDRPLMEMGLNSADLLALQRRIEILVGRALPSGCFFQFGTLAKMREHLEGTELAPTSLESPQPAPIPEEDSDADIAVVGMACRLPGGIEDPASLWRLLVEGSDALGTYPSERGKWRSDAEFPGIERGGFLRDGAAFDASFFRISPMEAQITDPQQRLLLELAWTCIEDARIQPSFLKGSDTGVFVGASNCDYAKALHDAGSETQAHSAIGSSLAVLANRLSYFFDLSGPSLLIDTACSSSLVALHTALQSLRSGECSQALVAGVNFICHPELSVAYHKAGMLSPDGFCKPFDAEANGYVRAEGAVILLLKPLRHAERDGNPIHAVLKGSATNHGGLAAGLTVPNPTKQGELLASAWQNAGISPHELTYIEAHGTGTSLGDPLEIRGIRAAIERAKADQRSLPGSCGIGTLKSNLGHLEPAAGIAGLLKVILALQNRKLPASIHYRSLNPAIDLGDSPLRIQDRLQDWTCDGRRVAGVSSFGSGGANAHVVVAEYRSRQTATKRPPAKEWLFTLSAEDEERLVDYAKRWIDWLEACNDDDFGEAMLASLTRTPMSHRLAAIVRTPSELRSLLGSWIASAPRFSAHSGLWTGRVRSGSGATQGSASHASSGDLSSAARLWVAGDAVQAQLQDVLAKSENRRWTPLALPTYPFARENHWLETRAPEAAPTRSRTMGFEEYWVEAPPAVLVTTPSRIVVFVQPGQVDDPCIPGAVVVEPADRWRESAADRFQARPGHIEDLRQILSRMAESESAPLTLVYGWAMDRGEAGILNLLGLFQAVQSSPALVRRVILLGRQTPGRTESCWDHSWIGFQHSLRSVLHEVDISVVLTDRPLFDAHQIVESTRLPAGTTWYSSGRRLVPSFREVALPVASAETSSAFRQGGTYLITGGCGALGTLVARHLAGRYSARLILMGRRPQDQAITAQLADLLASGATEATYVAMDLADTRGVQDWARGLASRLDGVLHAAGQESSGEFADRTVSSLRQALGAKTLGTLALDEALADLQLDFICYFSSSSAFLGDFGTCEYSIANRFLLAHAELASSRHRPGRTVAIHWPLWDEGRITLGDRTRMDATLMASGQSALDSQTGLGLLEGILRSGRTQTLVLTGEPDRLRSTLERIYHAKPAPIPSPILRHSSDADSVALLHDLKSLVSACLKTPVERIDEERNLSEFGFDSISLAEFSRRMTAFFGLPITPALFFSATTLARVADHLQSRHSEVLQARYPAGSPVPAPVSPPLPKVVHEVSRSETTGEPIAVIGMSGRFPGASDMDGFWNILAEGRDMIAPVPTERWDWREWYVAPGDRRNRMVTNLGGFLADVAGFDPLFFEVSPREAEEMDPAERLLLMESYRAIEEAGIAPSSLRGTDVGVFVGMEEGEYGGLMARHGSRQSVTTSGNAMVSSRLSYFLDLRGPVLATNTACSSGLVALHQAVTSLRMGECRMALAASCSLSLDPEGFVLMSRAGMLSPQGRSRTFSKDADGIGVGEAVVVFLLKPLSAALADGDAIHGVIRASGTNFDGRTNGVTAPNGRRQAELIESLYAAEGIDPSAIGHVITHGTGTRLGDPVEVQALQEAYASLGAERLESCPCALTSVKGNVGHTLAASGLVSLAALLLGMRHRAIPGTLHCREENEYLALDNRLFRINKTLSPWTSGSAPLLGAVSAFGRGGTNAHVVVQSAPHTEPFGDPPSPGEAIVPLSARTAEQLRQRVSDLATHLRSNLGTISLASLACTLQSGRDAMEHRVGFLVGSIADLQDKLDAWLAGGDRDGIFAGQARRGSPEITLMNQDEDLKDAIGKWVARRKLGKLLDLWVRGLEIDWTGLQGPERPRRMRLPVYPFSSQRYWFEPTNVAGAHLHPLVHQNSSDLSGQSFQTEFVAIDSWTRGLSLHEVEHIPASVCLEMARAAVEMAVPTSNRGPALELRDLKWPVPMQSSEGLTLYTRLSATANGIEIQITGRAPESGCAPVFFQALAEYIDALDAPPVISDPQLDTATARAMAEEFLDATTRSGLVHAPALRTIEALHRRPDGISARLRPEVGQRHAGILLAPALLEGAIHAASALLRSPAHEESAPFQPATIGRLSVFAPCTNSVVANAVFAPGCSPRDAHARLVVELRDEHGQLCVRLDDLEFLSRPCENSCQTQVPDSGAWDGASYISVWEEAPASPESQPSAHASRKVLVVECGSAHPLVESILEHHMGSDIRRIGISDRTCRLSHEHRLCGVSDPEGFATCLDEFRDIDTVYFLAGETPLASGSEGLLLAQESNEIQFLRLIQCLKQQARIAEEVDTFVLTLDTQVLQGTTTGRTGAGITGLAYALAQGLYPFRVRNLDLSTTDLCDAASARTLLQAILREPASDRGEQVKLQSGKRHRQSFLRLSWGPAAGSVLRQGGTYVIVGGTGAVGRVLTRKLMGTYQARVAWVGRSPEDSERVRSAKSALACEGDLLYVQADATDAASLAQAVDKIRHTFGRIDGAVFAGMVFDYENSLERTTEAGFRSILDVKTLGTHAFLSVLSAERPDFLCLFSSGQAYSFSGAAKLSAYAAGITAADHLATSTRTAPPVGIINWGFWKSSLDRSSSQGGSVEARNFDALDDDEGFSCFENFLHELQAGRLHRVLCMKASTRTAGLMNVRQDASLRMLGSSGFQTPAQSLSADASIPASTIRNLEIAREAGGLECRLLEQLDLRLTDLRREAGLLPGDSLEVLVDQGRVASKYRRWLQASARMLEGEHQGMIASSSCSRHEEWADFLRTSITDPHHSALAALAEACLSRLSDIILGRVASTDVIFPNASLEKVEGVYAGNPLSTAFNEAVAGAVESRVRELVRCRPGSRIRILEIGAGTGGTTSQVLPRLHQLQDAIEEYCYTDLSKAFFLHAAKRFQPEHPYLRCQRLDIEKPVLEQGFKAGAYDIVIATNVVHATRDIRRALRHAKVLLPRDGLLVLNELGRTSCFHHLTFGLLDGWWLFEDADLRLPDSPILGPDSWARILDIEGFAPVQFPARAAHNLGQQIILATSNGLVRIEGAAPSCALQTPGPLAARSTEPVAAYRPSPVAAPVPALTPKPTVPQPALDPEATVCLLILECLGNVLKLPSEDVADDMAFSDYGIDSILGVSFIASLNERLGISLNTAIIFEHSSARRLARHLVRIHGDTLAVRFAPGAEQAVDHTISTVASRPAHRSWTPLTSSRGVSSSVAPTATPVPHRETVEIAVIGMSGQFPKARSVEEFWNNLVDGVDGVEELPNTHLDMGRFHTPIKQAGKTRCKWGGVLAERDCFDPLFFSLSPKEAESMNPHQRLVLQESWNALEDAGCDPRTLANSPTGIFIGAEPTGYVGDSFTGYSDAIIASRLSYFLDLKGPAFVVNTGCSSSGVALHLACESLRSGETDLALAGGVNAYVKQDLLVRLDAIDMVSPTGRCLTFDGAADGTIISEGIGMVVLKRLDDALAAGDPIHGVIVGTGINQDGASNGITAPNGEAQEDLVASVHERFGIDPERISLVEAHGTGTRLGDPVEANALVRAFRKRTSASGFCAVGSAKSHIGHTAAAAGVVGLIKVLLCMRHARIPSMLHFRTMNPLIEFDGSPFYIPSRTIEWTAADGRERMACINSFGHSGTNAHIVVKEHVLSPRPSQSGDPRLADGHVSVILSAKSREQLHQRAAALLAWLPSLRREGDEPETAMLTSLAYTLQTGREAMEERLGFMVDSLKSLQDGLRTFLDGSQIPGMQQGRVRRLRSSSVPTAPATTHTHPTSQAEALKQWVEGHSPEWRLLYPVAPSRLHLPGYPFAKERYWVEAPTVDSTLTLPILHPMLHQNVSDLDRQRFLTVFGGDEFFLHDHRVRGHRVLPAVAYLEMARAAAERSSPNAVSGAVELRDVIWAQPIVVSDEQAVSISLYTESGCDPTAPLIDYVVSTASDDGETVHCQGQIAFGERPECDAVNLADLRKRMREQLDMSGFYPAYAGMGIEFGPAHRPLRAIHLGNGELLAELRLPAVVSDSFDRFQLHPSLMDGALQACIALIAGRDGMPDRPLLPFALDTLRIHAGFAESMTAWVRTSAKLRRNASPTSFDIDLIDDAGRVCARFLGFNARLLDDGSRLDGHERVDESSDEVDDPSRFDEAFYNQVLERILNNELTVDEATGLEQYTP